MTVSGPSRFRLRDGLSSVVSWSSLPPWAACTPPDPARHWWQFRSSMFMVSGNWLFTFRRDQETRLKTCTRATRSRSRICLCKVAVRLNSIWHCKLTSKQIWGKLSVRVDWFKAKDSPEAEIRGTFRGPWAALYCTVGMNRNTNHVRIEKPSHWEGTVVTLSLDW